MIFLHLADDAKQRVDAIAQKKGGDILRCELKPGYLVSPDEVAGWLRTSKNPKMIVVSGATIEDDGDAAHYHGIRQMVKSVGVDVHFLGDESLEKIADHIVRNDDDLKTLAPGSSVGEQIADLMRSEVMDDFKRAQMDIPGVQQLVAATGCSEDEARQRIEWMKAQEVYVNSLYQVNIETISPVQAHLIIRRIDGQPISNWNHFQTIKNAFMGPECEAMELYPKESNLVDAKNQYHLWGFTDPEKTFGIGFDKRQVSPTRK